MRPDRTLPARAPLWMFLALTAATLLFELADRYSPPDRPGQTVALVSALVASGCVLAIRRLPWLMMSATLVTLALDVIWPASGPTTYVLVAVGCTAVGAWGRQGILAVPLATAIVLAGPAIHPEYALLDTLVSVVLVALVASLSVMVGLSARRQEQIMNQLRAQHDQLVALQRRETQAALVTERTRIARELHDVVAHHVSALLIQAQAGQRLAAADDGPGAARWQDVTDSARQILQSMRRLVGLLRPDDEARRDLEDPDLARRSPQPGLADLEHLAESTRRLGLDVDVDLALEPIGDLPAEVQLTGYRIAQEALTNVLRHASATRATVRVTRTSAALLLDIVDDGRVADGFRPGNGLIGMRERAASLGGHLDVEARSGSGLRIHARLPTDPNSTSWASPPSESIR
jgi:signal transduction histidine kinase